METLEYTKKSVLIHCKPLSKEGTEGIATIINCRYTGKHNGEKMYVGKVVFNDGLKTTRMFGESDIIKKQ